jgi:hypothetical protein
VGCTAPRTRPSAEGRNRTGGQALRSTRSGHQRCRRVFRALGIALPPNIREADVAALIDRPCRPKRGAKNDVTARNYLMSKGFILNVVRAMLPQGRRGTNPLCATWIALVQDCNLRYIVTALIRTPVGGS